MAGPPAKPRLLMLVTLAEAGGAQSAVALLLPAVVEEFDVTLAAHGDGPLRDAARAAGARFVELKHVRRAINPWQDALGLVELVRLCRRVRPQVVHAHSSKAGALGRVAAALSGVPVRIFTVHGWSFAAYGGPAGRAYLLAERILGPLTSSVVCVAAAVRELGVVERACRPEQTVVIHNAVDLQSFDQPSRREGPPRIVSVGRFAFPKDFQTLVEALSLTRTDYRAAFVGDGPSAPDVSGLAGRIELLGTRDDVPALLAAADIFVLSSRSEGFPISILEAMAAGLPVVATDVGGVSEAVVHGETGLLVPPGDTRALADALEALLHDAARRRRLGAAGRERARLRFDLAGFTRAHLELYRRELGRCSAAQLNRANGKGVLGRFPPAEWRDGESQKRRLANHEQHEQQTGDEEPRRRAPARNRS